MLEALKQIDDLDFYFRKSNKEIVLVKFFTSWCSPCHQLKKVINDFLKENNKLVVLEIDAEKFVELAQKPIFNVKAVPTIFLLKKAKIISHFQGYMDLEKFRKFINI